MRPKWKQLVNTLDYSLEKEFKFWLGCLSDSVVEKVLTASASLIRFVLEFQLCSQLQFLAIMCHGRQMVAPVDGSLPPTRDISTELLVLGFGPSYWEH